MVSREERMDAKFAGEVDDFVITKSSKGDEDGEE